MPQPSDESAPTLWRPGFLRRPTAFDAKRRPIEAVEAAVRAATEARTAGGKVVVVQAQTASGKSSLIPPMVWQKFAMERRGGPGVICTQPRRLTAIRIAQDVGSYRTSGVELGVSLGWLTKVSARVPKLPTSLIYATVGSANSAFRGGGAHGTSQPEEPFQAFAQRWSYVIIDEAHERSLDLDLFLLRLKRGLREYADEPWCPVVIIMSATIDPDQWAQYFGAPDTGVVVVAGRTHPIREHWPQFAGGDAPPRGRQMSNSHAAFQGVPDLIAAAFDAVITANAKYPTTVPGRPGDFMVFLPGAAEHKALKARLEAWAPAPATPAPKFLALSIMGETVATEGEDYRALFRPLPRGIGRRVILASTVAETGLTVDTLLAVFDSGWNREPIYLPTVDAVGLLTAPASKRAVRQRMGRVGRVAPGEFFPLYAQAAFDALREQPLPEALTADAAGTLVQIMSELSSNSVANPGGIDFLTPLPPELAQAGLDKLYALGLAAPAADNSPALGAHPWGLTEVGRALAPALSAVAPELVMAVVGAHLWGASPRDVLAAATMAGARVSCSRMPPALMREVLPSKLVRGDAATGAAEAAELVSAARAAMADENAEGALLFARWTREMESSAKDADEWAQRAGFRASGLYSALAAYIEAADEITKTGVLCTSDAPTLLAAADDGPRAFTAALLKFKRSMEFGYRCNLATLDGVEYVTARGLRVRAPRFPPLNRLPRYLLYVGCGLAPEPDGAYGAHLAGVSVLDGFTRGGHSPSGGETSAPGLRDYWQLRRVVRDLDGTGADVPLNHFEGGLSKFAADEWFAPGAEGEPRFAARGFTGGEE
jgi:HrpA-like RNA helicase